MSYTIIYSSRAAKHLEKLPSDITLKVIKSISELKYDPYHHAHKMKGIPNIDIGLDNTVLLLT